MTLYVVGTPIGNLSDLSPRAADVLSSVDAVICEDSRRTGRLLAHVGAGDSPERARPELIVANEHTEVPRLPVVLDRLADGQRLALVTDAGMPTVSDPGAAIIAAVTEAGHRVEVVPGPTAVGAAVAVSGIDARRFVFEGFLPRKGAERRDRLAEVGAEKRAVVLYEAPHRLRRTLDDLVTVCGPDRPVAVCRELTKLHEEVVRATLAELVDRSATVEPRGEYVLVLAGRSEPNAEPSDADLVDALRERLAHGDSRRDAVAAVMAATGQSKRRIYDLANAIEVSPDRSTP